MKKKKTMTTINREIKLLPFKIPTDINCCYADRNAESFIISLKSLTEDEAKVYAMMIHNEILQQWEKSKLGATIKVNPEAFRDLQKDYVSHQQYPKDVNVKNINNQQ